MGEPRGTVHRFTDLEVWRKSHELFLNLLFDLDALPNTRPAAVIADQRIRSLGSIGANIAEGFNRSKAKYLNCLDIALGEANETENWLYKLRDSKLLSIGHPNRKNARRFAPFNFPAHFLTPDT
jgi:four helix bundle protein